MSATKNILILGGTVFLSREIARQALEQEKVLAVICHGPWLLVEADGVRGKRVTGWRSIRSAA